ncbi:MAG: hypothetical protein AB8G23_09775 [Myxococcota bacterium]
MNQRDSGSFKLLYIDTPTRLAQALGLLAAALFLTAVTAAPSQAAPDVALHDLNWFVHVDLVNGSENLAYWQGVIEDSLDSANNLLEGGQGPFDQACCTRFEASVSLSTFGSPGDGLDVMNTVSDQNWFDANSGGGSNGYLIDSMTYCGGSSPSAIGCAERPNCNGNGNDNPNLWMVVTVESFDDDTLPSVIAHERGHNSCLQHVNDAGCQIMQGTVFSPGLGGCMSASECSNFQAAQTTTSSGAECGCQTDAGEFEPDNTACIDAAGFGVCSGGVCGETTGPAAAKLIAAAEPGSAGSIFSDDALEISALSGNWKTLAEITSPSSQIRGMAYATDSSTLYGVVPGTGDDRLITIDPDTGLELTAPGLLANGASEMISMAYDPGATDAASDDRLLVLEVTGSSGQVRAIDPASPNVSTLLGSIIWQPAGEFKGLAYDSINQKLYATTPFGPDGLYEIDLTTCPPSPCESAQVPGAGLFRQEGSLAYSVDSGLLYLVGTSFGGARTFYNIIDPATGTSAETLSLDVFSPSALAALPEPTLVMSLGIGVMGLGLAARSRKK